MASHVSDLVAVADPPAVGLPNRFRVRRSRVLAVFGASALILLIIVFVAIFQVAQRSPVVGLAATTDISPDEGMTSAALPLVEPVTLLDVPVVRAREVNAAVAFSSAPNPVARPFIFSGALVDHERAVDCLASAAFYEAGNNVTGQRSVAQVVLNRVRHPAFPKTVCGVVFQGSERKTGCQFSYTCDGAFNRVPSPQMWSRARATARLALSGSVYAPVGYATHYHTDWVVPAWSPKMEKITAVLTHLFFRWKGHWGRPAVFRDVRGGVEPSIPLLAALSWSHRSGVGDEQLAQASEIPETIDIVSTAEATPAIVIKDLPPTALQNSKVHFADPTQNIFILHLDRTAFPGSYAVVAYNICRRQSPGPCHVMGWTDVTAIPAGLPLTSAARATMTFDYRRDPIRKTEVALWNCAQVKRDFAKQCISGSAVNAASAPATQITQVDPS